MFDAKKLLDQFLGGAKDGKTGGLSGDFMKGAGAAGIAGILLSSKSGRKLAGSAVKYGGIAVLGGLAYSAYKNWQDQKQAEGECRTAADERRDPRRRNRQGPAGARHR